MTVIDRKRPDFETPEHKNITDTIQKYFDFQTDKHIKDVWVKAYVEMIKTKPREEARITADETVEDYLERFSEEF